MTNWLTTGTPVLTGAGAGADILLAQPLPRTWLSLGRYANIMGINPISFYGAVAENTAGSYIGSRATCNEIWYQYDWQDVDKVSRTALLLAIQDAENDIAMVLGRPLAPTWIVEEVHAYTKFYNIGYGSWYGADGRRKSVIADWSPVIAPGRRAVTRVGAAAVAPTYHDLDADGFFETARVSVATTQTEVDSIKVYFKDALGNEEWEIRPCRKKSITAGVFTADFYTWQFIDPDLWETFPVVGDNPYEVDISGNPPGNVVAEVDVYYEYNDNTLASAQFLWEAQHSLSIPTTICSCCGGTGCSACGLTTQDGCFDVRNADIGEVAPWPATYTDSSWVPDSFTVCSEPDMVKLWYFAGEYNQRFLRDIYHDSLSDKWARIIARMATSRLSKPICSCGNLSSLFDYLAEDMAVNIGDKSTMIDMDALANPFGTRRGEMEAWRYVYRNFTSGVSGVAL